MNGIITAPANRRKIHLRAPGLVRPATLVAIESASVPQLLQWLAGGIQCPNCGDICIVVLEGQCRCPSCSYWANAAGLGWRVTCDDAAMARVAEAVQA